MIESGLKLISFNFLMKFILTPTLSKRAVKVKFDTASVKDFTCRSCFTQFARKKALNKHLREYHTQDENDVVRHS